MHLGLDTWGPLRQCPKALLNQDLGDDRGQMKKEAHVNSITIKTQENNQPQGPINTSIGTSGSTLSDHPKTTINHLTSPEIKVQCWTK